MAVFDLVLRNARPDGRSEPADIGVAGGRIAAIARGLPAGGAEFDCRGRLVCGGLVETHIHLDKAGIIGRCRNCEGTLAEAVAETARAKAAFTTEDVFARANAVVERAVLAGTTRMRSFVEIDPRAGFRSFEALKAIRDAWKLHIDIQICAFAQEGLTNEPATAAMLDRALGDGADLVGGCPYTDPDPRAHVAGIVDLAAKHDVDVDFHIDFDLDPAGSALPVVIDETERRGWGGRVAVGHATKLSAMPPGEAAITARRLGDAGVGVVVLPATDLYLNGRASTHLVPRGVTPAHRLLPFGLTAALATNNVMNPFTPFGDADLVRMANLYATVAQAGTPGDLSAVWGMVTDGAARLVRAEGYGIREGGPADLVVLDAGDGAEAVATVGRAVAGWKNGRMSFERPMGQVLREAVGR